MSDGPHGLLKDVMAERDTLAKRVAELEAKPPTFIKLDETTEAFQQTHAAIENMKMFQKDAIFLREQLATAKAEIEHLQRQLADERSGDCDKDKAIRLANQRIKELESDVAILKGEKASLMKSLSRFTGDA